MLNQSRLDALEPMQRADFDLTPVRTWRITWPNGSTELERGHLTQPMDDGRAIAFHYSYLGAHRIVNLGCVRDIVEVPADDEK